MKGKPMIEKRCKIELTEATFISVSCKHCKGETNIPMKAHKTVEVCGVCGVYFGEQAVAYIRNLKKTTMLEDNEDVSVSLVSVERVS